jgi:hypothetical protein
LRDIIADWRATAASKHRRRASLTYRFAGQHICSA